MYHQHFTVRVDHKLIDNLEESIDGAFVGNDVTSAKDLLVADALLREFRWSVIAISRRQVDDAAQIGN